MKNKKRLLLILLLLFLTLGYAILSSTFTINGNSIIASSTWNIHFENIVPKEGSVEIGQEDTAATINPNNDKEVNYEVTLSKPGDFYEFNVDIKNDGTIDGMVEVITSTLKMNDDDTITILDDKSNLPEYLDYSITYSDNTEILQNHLLKAGNKETYKVRVEFKKDIDESILPKDDNNILLTIRPTIIQADDNAIEKEEYSPFTYDIDLDSIQNTTIQYDKINQEECVEYFSQEAPAEIEVDAYCRGEDVTYQGNTINLEDVLNNSSSNDLQILSDNGVITLKYFGVKSIDINNATCIDFLNNQGWDDVESLCNGGPDQWGDDLKTYIFYDGSDWYIQNGIITNVEYGEIKPNVIITGYKESVEVPTDLVIPRDINGKKVVGIANNSFSNKGITTITIPNTVEYIGESAFYDNNLNNVNIGGNNVSIGECAFGNLKNIETHNISDDYSCSTSLSCFTYGVTANGEMGDIDYSYIVDYDSSCGSEVVIPKSIETIGSGALMDKGITSVEIPSSASLIMDDAFNNNNLESVLLKGNDHTIDKCAFGDIQNITIHNIPNNYYCDSANNENAVTYLSSLVGNDKLKADNYGNYRYYGNNLWKYDSKDGLNSFYSEPKNYVKFNNELWRIIGIFDVSKTIGGTPEKRIKIIKDNPIDFYSWDSSLSNVNNGNGLSDWTQADLMYELNGDYLDNSLNSNPSWYNGPNDQKNQEFNKSMVLKPEAQNLIDDAVWYLGGARATAQGFYDNNYGDCYETERSDLTNAWVGKVGLPYLSDASIVFYDGDSYYRYKYSFWIGKYKFWTIDKNVLYNDSRSGIFAVTFSETDHNLAMARGGSDTQGVRPTVYLKNNVKITGEGTYSNPYEFSLN